MGAIFGEAKDAKGCGRVTDLSRGGNGADGSGEDDRGHWLAHQGRAGQMYGVPGPEDLRGRDLLRTQCRYWMRTSSGTHELGVMQTGAAQVVVSKWTVVQRAVVKRAMVQTAAAVSATTATLTVTAAPS